MLKGIGASQGYGIGRAVVIKDCNLDYRHVKYAGAEEEKAKLHRAVDAFVEETKNANIIMRYSNPANDTLIPMKSADKAPLIVSFFFLRLIIKAIMTIISIEVISNKQRLIV